MEEGKTGNRVKLYVYDLSFGLSQMFSSQLLGKRIDGIWHTSVVVFDKEYYFGQSGIVSCQPGYTNLGEPLETHDLGTTDVTEDLLEEYIHGLREHTFALGTYNLLKHNCNTFSNELVQFLCGKEIPQHILQLPDEVIQCLINNPYSPLVNLLSEFVTTNNRRTSPDFDQLNDDIDAARKYY